MGLFSSSSRSTNVTEVTDQRIGSDNGSISLRELDANNVTFGSDETAQLAIESSTNALTASTDFIGGVLTKFLNVTDRRLERADKNIAVQNKQTAELLQKEQQTSDDRLIKIIQYALIAGVFYSAIKSGVIKDAVRAIK